MKSNLDAWILFWILVVVSGEASFGLLFCFNLVRFKFLRNEIKGK